MTRCWYFKALVRLVVTVQPAEDLSAAGSPLRAAPIQASGRRSLAAWLPFHRPLLVVTCASMPIIESLTQLLSCYIPSSLTSHPQGYIKICTPKGSWKWDTPLPLIPPVYPHVYVKMMMVHSGAA